MDTEMGEFELADVSLMLTASPTEFSNCNMEDTLSEGNCKKKIITWDLPAILSNACGSR